MDQDNLELLSTREELLKQDVKPGQPRSSYAFLLFRLGSDWFALSTKVVYQIYEVKPVHTVPHRSNPILLGVTNLGGYIRVVVSINHLLNISHGAFGGYRRMLELENRGDHWAFIADEVLGIIQCESDDIKPLSSQLLKPYPNFFKGSLSHDKKEVRILDEELLLHHLLRSI